MIKLAGRNDPVYYNYNAFEKCISMGDLYYISSIDMYGKVR